MKIILTTVLLKSAPSALAWKSLMKNIVLLLWFIGAGLLTASLHAQPGREIRIKFEHLTVEDGLAHNRVWRIMQDRKGFLWFATGYGLSRYDGYKFTNFQKQGVGTLSHDAIWAVFEDHAGTLWAGTYGGGLNKFDAASQTFRHFLHDPENPNSLSNNVVRDILELSGEPGVLWIATIGGGLNRFDTRTETFTRFEHDPNDSSSLANNSVHTLYESRDGVLWLGTGDGFSRLNRSKKPQADNSNGRDASAAISFTNYQYQRGNSDDLYRGGVSAILESKDGTLWVGANEGGLSRFDRKSETYVHYFHDPDDPKSLSRGSVRALFEDAAGVIWIGIYGGGLNKFERSTQTFKHYSHDPDDPHSLSYDIVRDIFEDRSGVMWVATFGGGVSKVVRKQFALFRHEPNNPNSLLHNDINHIFEDLRDAVWVDMKGSGLTRIAFDEGPKPSYTHFIHDPANANSLSSNDIRKPVEFSNQPGIFWISTNSHGLNRLDTKTNRIVRFEHQPDNANSLSSNTISAIQQSLRQPEILWIGAVRGQLNRLDAAKAKFTHFNLGVRSRLTRIYESPHQPGVLWVGTTAKGLIRFDSENKVVSHILEDDLAADLQAHIEGIYESPRRPGVLWVTTDREGFYRVVYDGSTNKAEVKTFRHQPENPNSLASDKLWAFCETDDGVLWFGTEKGLSRFDPENEIFTNYTTENGLSDNFIESMLPDANGHIWIATNNGLSRFTPATEHFRIYTVDDGLQGNSFNPYAFEKGRDGRLYFGGLDGMVMFHPDSIKDNPHVPPVVITDFRIFNKPVQIDPEKADEDQTLPAHFSTLDKIVLSHRENVFSFEFAALDYTAPEKNQYAYKMEGFNDDWIYVGTGRTASFTNLDPSEYTFRVKGSNHDGVWNEQGASIKVIILPPWWQTWWAYLFYGLAIFGSLYILRRYEKNRQQHKHQANLRQMEARKLQEVDHLKSSFFANISHEFRTPLTLIMGQVESVLPQQEQPENKNKLSMALRNAKQLLRLINQLLDLSKIEAGGMRLNARPGNIVPLLRSLTASFESLAQQKQIDLRFECAHDRIIVNFEPDKIEKIMYNLLSNAMKFTPEGGSVKVAVALGSSSGTLHGEQTATATASATAAVITVRDSGIGIQQNRLAYVFDRFYQVDSTETREHEGTGIGLALTKELVELHGGTIVVESTEGFGTTFVVRLPVISQSEAEIPTTRDDQFSVTSDQFSVTDYEYPATSDKPERSGDPDFSGQPATSDKEPATSNMSERSGDPDSSGHQASSRDFILIVEDNADVRSFIRENLADAYRLIEAKDGEEGFTKAQEYIPDLIITDVMMPKVDGYELARKIRADELTSHIPLIMLTAKAAEEEKLEGLETGVDAYLIKPFNTKELRVRVRKLIEMRRQLRQQTGTKAMLSPAEVQVSSMDQEFLQKVRAIIEEEMENEDFGVEELAAKASVGMRQLQRKLKALTDASPQQCIRGMRLQRAKQLLEQKAGTVSEIAFQVGYGDVTAFSKAFRAEYGQSPSEMLPGKEKQK